MHRALLSISLVLLSAFFATAQDDDGSHRSDLSTIPASASSPAGFAGSGWKVEKSVRADLNGDGRPDYAIALIENKIFDTEDKPGPDRNRVLVVAFSKGNSLKRVALSEKLLQCTSCGGAFYGVIDAPAHLAVSKGVIVVNQDHGSREVSESTYRFRYDEASGRFVLIGHDYEYYDRAAAGNVAKESTNYVTGLRITTIGQGKRSKTKRSTVQPTTIYLDTIDADETEYAAEVRIGHG
jgi:hypothetical protein